MWHHQGFREAEEKAHKGTLGQVGLGLGLELGLGLGLGFAWGR